jgi:ketopantoate reductase
MRVAVFGTGGVGGYFGARLAAARSLAIRVVQMLTRLAGAPR